MRVVVQLTGGARVRAAGGQAEGRDGGAGGSGASGREKGVMMRGLGVEVVVRGVRG